jgi:hypothetical protein
MDPRSRNASSLVARMASRAKGIATREALLGAGLSATQIRSRVRSGLLIPEYPGVYRVGHAAPSAEATYMAAVLAAGEGAAISGMPAAWLEGLIRGKPPHPEVSAPNGCRVKGLKARRRRLHPGEVMTVRGIRTTIVPLTLLDLSPSLPLFELGRACHEAGVRYRTTPAQVKAVLARRPNTKGAAKLRTILEGDPISLSRLEQAFLALLRAHDLPLPVTNKPAGGKRVDCRWPEHRREERQAYARGDAFRRYTWMDVLEEPRALLRELIGLLVDLVRPMRSSASARHGGTPKDQRSRRA